MNENAGHNKDEQNRDGCLMSNVALLLIGIAIKKSSKSWSSDIYCDIAWGDGQLDKTLITENLILSHINYIFVAFFPPNLINLFINILGRVFLIQLLADRWFCSVPGGCHCLEQYETGES